MNIRTIRENILAAKEKRAFLRAQYAASEKSSLSLSLNIPGYPKCEPLFAAFFDRVLSELKRFLLAHRIILETDHEICASDEAGEFYLAPLADGKPLEEIKVLCEDFEERHPVGRVLDIDLTDAQGGAVSSGKLKQCFLCDRPAIICMREQHHNYQELRERITARMMGYLKQQHADALCKQLAAIALKATLYELSASPKPGLVDRFDNGAHQDMDYFSFLNSSAALAGYFEEFAESGLAFDDKDLTKALPIIRNTGLKMEQAMLEATGGVNTHKGLIFLLGLSIFATSFVLSHHKGFHEADLRKTISGICRNLVHKELSAHRHDSTHGASCFQHYGEAYGGARQEGEEGFPSIFEHGLPALKSRSSDAGGFMNAPELNAALTQTLLSLMAQVNDTNILYRTNPATLETVKQMAHSVLDAVSETDRSSRYADLIDFCRQQQVSPGGSADLLVVTVFFYDVERAYSQDLTDFKNLSGLGEMPKTDEYRRTVS